MMCVSAWLKRLREAKGAHSGRLAGSQVDTLIARAGADTLGLNNFYTLNSQFISQIPSRSVTLKLTSRKVRFNRLSAVVLSDIPFTDDR